MEEVVGIRSYFKNSEIVEERLRARWDVLKDAVNYWKYGTKPREEILEELQRKIKALVLEEVKPERESPPSTPFRGGSEKGDSEETEEALPLAPPSPPPPPPPPRRSGRVKKEKEEESAVVKTEKIVTSSFWENIIQSIETDIIVEYKKKGNTPPGERGLDPLVKKKLSDLINNEWINSQQPQDLWNGIPLSKLTKLVADQWKKLAEKIGTKFPEFLERFTEAKGGGPAEKFKNVYNNIQKDTSAPEGFIFAPVKGHIGEIASILESIETHSDYTENPERISTELYEPIQDHLTEHGVPEPLTGAVFHLGLTEPLFHKVSHNVDMTKPENQMRYLRTLSVIANILDRDAYTQEEIDRCFAEWPY